MTRVVLDTNVLVAALILKGRLTRLVDLWKAGVTRPVFSKETFAELQAVLSYAKFKLSREDIRSMITDEILPFFDVIDVTERIRGVCRAPSDDMFLSVAMSAGASHIVTGDKDLLALGAFRTIRMLTPQALLASLR